MDMAKEEMDRSYRGTWINEEFDKIFELFKIEHPTAYKEAVAHSAMILVDEEAIFNLPCLGI